MQIVIDGLITEYYKTGKGPIALFLHGWGDTAKTFNGLIGVIAEDFTCLSLDLPGFGATEVPSNAWTLGSYAEFVNHFLLKLEVQNVAVIIGHSNGGALALKGVEDGILKTDKLVLLSSSGIRPKKSVKTSLIMLGAKAGKPLSKLLPRANRKALRKALYKKVGSDYLVAPQMAETFKKVVREDVRAKLGSVKMPVLLVYGQEDTDTPIWIAKKFAQLLPDARLHTVRLAGHFVHLDALAETIKVIKEFTQT